MINERVGRAESKSAIGFTPSNRQIADPTYSSGRSLSKWIDHRQQSAPKVRDRQTGRSALAVSAQSNCTAESIQKFTTAAQNLVHKMMHFPELKVCLCQ